MVEKGFLPLSSMHPHLSFKTPAPAAPFSTPKSRGVQQREFFFKKNRCGIFLVQLMGVNGEGGGGGEEVLPT